MERVRQQKRMRVGLVENAPWVRHGQGDPSGAEVQLVRDFATSLGAAPEWFWGGEQQHLEALERFELDLVIGGLDASTPWAQKIGLTRQYYTERILVGIPAGTPNPIPSKEFRLPSRTATRRPHGCKKRTPYLFG